MPSRLITAAILAFWLRMTGLLLQREVVPMMLAEVAPTFHVDLTDEIGSPLVAWTMYSDGKRIGTANSKINALDERRFEFRSRFQFDNREFIPGLKSIETVDRVAEDGKLLALSMKIVHDSLKIEVDGEVVAHKFKPRITWNDIEHSNLVGEIDLAEQSNVSNALKLVSRLRGLHEGQTWKETPFDPSGAVQDKFARAALEQFKASSMIAQVKVDMLVWDQKEVVCHVVEYHDVKQEIVARVWARRRDGLVLQREVRLPLFGKNLTLQRVPH